MPCLALLIALRQQNREATYYAIARLLADRENSSKYAQAAQLMALAHESAPDFEEDVHRWLLPDLQLEETKSVCTEVARVYHKITERASPAKASLQSSPHPLREDSIDVPQPVLHNASKVTSKDISREILDIIGNTF